MSRYVHEQLTPASVWVVEHNLVTRAPILDAFVEIDGVNQRLQPKAVKMVDLNTVHVEWSVPRTGKVGVV